MGTEFYEELVARKRSLEETEPVEFAEAVVAKLE